MAPKNKNPQVKASVSASSPLPQEGGPMVPPAHKARFQKST